MTDQPLSRYPKHYLVGIVDDLDAASRAAEELRALGLHDVHVLRGRSGASELDSDGSEHGIFASILRAVEHVTAEIDHMAEYEKAVREGAAVVAGETEDESTRAEAAEVLRKHDARFVNYFGGLAVELLVR